MKKVTKVLVGLVLLFLVQNLTAQEEAYQKKIVVLKEQKDKIAQQEKEALKLEIEEINKRVERGEISKEKAEVLKKESAQKRALNIDNRLAIIDNRIDLLERNGANVLELDTLNYETAIQIGLGTEEPDGGRTFGFRILKNPNRVKYDRRTYSDFILGIGFHNNIIRGESFFDTPHSILGSRYFELGYMWETRILKKSNWLRVNYGVIYENKGLKSGQQIFVNDTEFMNPGDVILDNVNNVFLDDNVALKKSKFRQDAFIFPIHLEFGPSSKKQNGDYVRYSTRKKFKFGIGAYLGLAVKNIQKIKFEKGSRGSRFPTNRRPLAYGVNDTSNSGSFWGWSMYAGKGNTTAVFKLEGADNRLSGSQGARQNVSLGLRFGL